MMQFQKYENYVDSEIQWLGDIPSHWAILPFKAMFEISNEKNGTNIVGEMLSVSGYRGIEVKNYQFEEQKRLDKDLVDYRVVRKGQLVVNTMWLNYAGLGVSELEGHVSPAYRAYNMSDQLHKRFTHYLMRSESYVRGYTSMMQGIRPNSLQIKNVDFHRFPILIPEYNEQKRIAQFLDEKTAEIDTTIAQKERLLALLAEQKAILINTVVTRGLDGEAAVRDSGVSWLGKIPAHWGISRSKWLFAQRHEKALPDDIQLSATQAYGVISQAEYMKREGRRVTQITQHLEKRKHVEVDDFVISMRSFQGGLERAWEQGCIRSSYVVLRPSPQIDIDFFAYLFKSHSYIQALRATSNFIRDGQDLNFNNFSQVDLPIIPLDEQRKIAAFLVQAAQDKEKAEKQIMQEIELLKEYKTCVIAEAVTGKIKI